MGTQLATIRETAPALNFSSAFFDSWVKYIDAKPSTAASYTRAIRQFRTYLQAHAINFPQREDVIQFREALKTAGRKPTTIQAYMQAVKLFFQWTEQEGLYSNIADHIKGAKLEQGHKRDYLTARQAGKLLDSIDREKIGGKRDYAILVTMLTSGLRTIEVVRANIGDLRTVADFLALYGEKSNYHKTPFTATSFYQYDDVWDGKDGYINAYLYGDKKLIKRYRNRFDGVRIFIMPDTSMFSDLDIDYNRSQLKRALIGAVILQMEFHAVVIPNISYISEETFPLYFDAIKYTSVAAISLKGHIRYANS